MGHNKGSPVGKRPEVVYPFLQEGDVVLAKENFENLGDILH